MNYPKLIPVEAFPVQENGSERFIGLRDPQRNDRSSVIVSELAYYVLTFFDGKTTIDEVIENFKVKFGHTLDKGEIEDLLNQLDSALLIENEKYYENWTRMENEFQNSEVRNCFLSGLSYPENRNDLDTLISGFYEKAENHNNNHNGQLKGIISPHIDFNRGGVSYAIAYRELIEQADADTFVIFGTSHYARNSNPFILTKKTFSTPYSQKRGG